MRLFLQRHAGLAWALAAAFAVFVYFFDLGGLHIPKNGDEYPYAHITRLTAASGHLLPLQSELEDMRNTKPPLLFWQGIASTDWGTDWTLWQLRYPSVLYTLATALLTWLLVWRLSGDKSKAWLGALTYLACFSTYRFGRPFLTNPPEVFWLFLPFFLLLFRQAAFASATMPLLLGAVLGVGLLYKSFALLLPTGLTLAWWYLHQRDYRVGPWWRMDAWKLAVIAAVALMMFSLWFLLDPQPHEIWREFVLKENAGKFQRHGVGPSYMAKLLHGPSSFWVLLFGYPFNGGLLAFPIFGLMVSALRQRAELSREEKMLWMLLAVFMVVFTLPSQRSARYLLPAMPGLAVLCALGWQRISRIWFLLSLAATGLVLGIIAFLALRIQQALPGEDVFPLALWIALAMTGGVAVFAALKPALTRPLTPVVALSAFLCSTLFISPFEGPRGAFDKSAQQQVVGKTVAVPYNFNAKFEAYRFLLPGAEIQGYRERDGLSQDELASRYQTFVVRAPLSASPCQGCVVLGQRLDLKGRQTGPEMSAILRGQILENLLVKEMLIVSTQGQR